MPTYRVHIYREMRLVFGGIEADSHEAAATIARGKLTEDADSINDCEGENIAALIDVQGDEEFDQSRLIDFESEQIRRAARKLLSALRLCHEQLSVWVADTESCDLSPEDDEALAAAVDAIAEAEGAGITAAPTARALLASLQAVLPYAEAEAQSLHECWRRDGDLQVKDELDRLERHIENANAVIAAANAVGITPLKTVRASGLLDAIKVAEGFVHWALDHGGDQSATAAALQFVRTAIAEAEATWPAAPATTTETEAAASTDVAIRPYSVLLLYRDYANDGGNETYYAWVKAPDPITAIADAQRQAQEANEWDIPENYADPNDFVPLLVTEGHHCGQPISND